MSKLLGTWPVLPIILRSSDRGLGRPKSDQRWDNRVAALESEHSNRIREIYIFDMTTPRWKRFAAAMQKPFPELTHLRIFVEHGDVAPVLADSFLDGSAPHLRELSLGGVPFPSMPKLLLSANGIVTLSLENIPGSGYIPPDAMATALTVMTRLETFRIGLCSVRSHFDLAGRHLPPPTPFVLPALTKLTFGGVYKYLEDLLARIDAPLLYDLQVAFYMDLNFDVPQLHRFIANAKAFKAYAHAELLLSAQLIELNFYYKTRVVAHPPLFELRINCGELDSQLPPLVQICSSSFPLISALEELQIGEHNGLPLSSWIDDMENAQWLELLGPFTGLKNLYLTHDITQRVCDALQELSGERATEVLPALRNIFVDGFWSFDHMVQEALRPYVTARQLSGHPVTIKHWRRENLKMDGFGSFSFHSYLP